MDTGVSLALKTNWNSHAAALEVADEVLLATPRQPKRAIRTPCNNAPCERVALQPPTAQDKTILSVVGSRAGRDALILPRDSATVDRMMARLRAVA